MREAIAASTSVSSKPQTGRRLEAGPPALTSPSPLDHSGASRSKPATRTSSARGRGGRRAVPAEGSASARAVAAPRRRVSGARLLSSSALDRERVRVQPLFRQGPPAARGDDGGPLPAQGDAPRRQPWLTADARPGSGPPAARGHNSAVRPDSRSTRARQARSPGSARRHRSRGPERPKHARGGCRARRWQLIQRRLGAMRLELSRSRTEQAGSDRSRGRPSRWPRRPGSRRRDLDPMRSAAVNGALGRRTRSRRRRRGRRAAARRPAGLQ